MCLSFEKIWWTILHYYIFVLFRTQSVNLEALSTVKMPTFHWLKIAVTTTIIIALTTPKRGKNKFTFTVKEVRRILVWIRVSVVADSKIRQGRSRNSLTLARIVSMHACKGKTLANTGALHSRQGLFSICGVRFY